MGSKIFNPKKLDKLNNPRRLEALPPKLIAEKIKISNPSVIIDFGAGTGMFSKAFSEIYSECKIYACDIAKEMIEWMTENVVSEYENIIPVEMNGEEVPLESEVADIVLMINLHHELDDHIKVLNECKRLLKKNGKIVVSDWKKVKTESGPSLDIRIEDKVVKDQLLAAGFQNVEIFNEFINNYLVIAEKC
jgi:ubiquinone/menaquinone biosynthesis C-methylase UbiE